MSSCWKEEGWWGKDGYPVLGPAHPSTNTPRLLTALCASDSEWLVLGENSPVPAAAAELRCHPQHQRDRPGAVPGPEPCGQRGGCLPGGLRAGKRPAGPGSGVGSRGDAGGEAALRRPPPRAGRPSSCFKQHCSEQLEPGKGSALGRGVEVGLLSALRESMQPPTLAHAPGALLVPDPCSAQLCSWVMSPVIFSNIMDIVPLQAHCLWRPYQVIGRT